MDTAINRYLLYMQGVLVFLSKLFQKCSWSTFFCGARSVIRRRRASPPEAGKSSNYEGMDACPAVLCGAVALPRSPRTCLQSLFLRCLVVSLVLSTGCGGTKDPGDRVALGVGTREITARQLERDLKRIRFEMGLGGQKAGPITESLVDRVVDHYLILEYGLKNHIQITEQELDLAVQEVKRDYSEEDFQKVLLEGYIDFEDWQKALEEQLLVRKILEKASETMNPVSFQEIKTYYDTHPGEFRRPQMVKFRQIVLRTEAEAEMVSGKLKKGEDFESLARTHSISPEGGGGGLVDWIGRNNLNESMAKPLFSLSVGKTSTVVRTEYGFHIFRVLSRRPEGQQSLPESMAQIESKLVYEKQTHFFREWLGELRTQYPIWKDQDVIKTIGKEG